MLSDTHCQLDKVVVPDGDLLLHAGDLTYLGTQKEIRKELAILSSLPHKYKIFCSGNHDWLFDPNTPRRFRGKSLYHFYSKEQILAQFPSLIYLQDSSVEIEGWKIYGSPWQPWYYDWAFQFKQTDFGHDQAYQTWAKIPDDVEILLTHTPAAGIRDTDIDDSRSGCPALRARLNHLEKLRLHVFGHIHYSAGQEAYVAEDGSGNRIDFVNAAICDIEYHPTNPPIVIDLERK